jgi:site-specific recombinase XerD
MRSITVPDRHGDTSRKGAAGRGAATHYVPDSLAAWSERYLALAVRGVRSVGVTDKITLHLARFGTFLLQQYGHDRLSACVRRDVVAWQTALRAQGLAPATINNHLASLSAFTTWVQAQAPGLFPVGDPAKGIGELSLGPLEPRALRPAQVRLKNLCDRLERFHQCRDRRHPDRAAPLRAHGRPWRDRALIFVLLSTGLRREELVRLNLDQLAPGTPAALRQAHRARLMHVQGKGKSERTVFLSADARTALADYLERERPGDADLTSTAVFLSARGLIARAADGRLSSHAINLVLTRIGRSDAGTMPRSATPSVTSRPCARTTSATPSPSTSRRSPARMRTNWNAG